MAHDLLIALLFAVSAGCSIIWLSWPKLYQAELQDRLSKIEGKLAWSNDDTAVGSDDKTSGFTQLKKYILDRVVKMPRISKLAESPELIKTLRMAGFRGRAAVNNYILAKTVIPVSAFVIGTIYFPVVFGNRVPFLVALVISIALGILGYYSPELFIKNRITKRQRAIARAWPEAIDLLLISVEAGMSVEAAFRKATNDLSRHWPELAAEFSITSAELAFLQDRKLAFQNLAERVGLDEVKNVVSVLIQAERYGTSLGNSLRVLAQESRNMRMRAAEQKAASLPPKLTIPMIVFFMPILLTVIAAPAIIDIFRPLR